MANLHETATWADAIYQLERTDPMTGGEDGIANRQAGQLANRTKWLKEELNTRRIELDAKITDSIAALINDAPNSLNTLGAIAAALDNNTRVGAELSSALARVAALEASKSDIDHLHDDRYYTQDAITEQRATEAARVDADIAAARARLDGVDAALARGYVAKYRQDGLAPGWYTIATNKGGQDHWASRAIARFGIWDIGSSLHQAVVFYASHHFGTNGSNALTVLANSHHGGFPFKHIRIKENGTYDGAALQVYVDGGKHTVSVSAAILGDNMQHSGWVLRDWIPDSSNPPPDVLNWANFTPKSQMDLAQSAQGGMATTGDIYAGGDLVQHPVLHAGNMAGAIIPFAMTTLPDGWLACHGGTVSRTTFARLFAAIGTTWGAGDGATTFHLPDLRGEFLRGFDDGRGVDAGRVFASYQAGTKIAGEVGSENNQKPNAHTIHDIRKVHGDPIYETDFDRRIQYDIEANNQRISENLSSVWCTTRPRNIAITYGIKY